MAELLNMSRKAYTDLENGKTKPNPENWLNDLKNIGDVHLLEFLPPELIKELFKGVTIRRLCKTYF